MPEDTVRILVVEDNPADVRLVVEMLATGRGRYDVDTVPGLDAALERLRDSPPDILLLDVGVQGTPAVDALRQLREKTENLPAVILSGLSHEEVVAGAALAGADDYLVKGRFNREVLVRAIRYAMERRRATAALRESEERFHRLLENAPDVIYRYRLTPEPGFEYVSPAVASTTGYTPEEHYADPLLGLRIVHPDDRPLLEAGLRGELPPGAPHVARWIHKDGRVVWTEHRTVTIRDDAGQPVAVEGISRDITDRVQADEEIRLRTRALEAAANAVLITDTHGRILWVNPAFTSLTGYTADEVVGRNPHLLKSGKQDDALYEQLWKTILAGQVWSGELVNRRKDGTLYTEEMTITPVRSETGAITHFVAIKQDVTQRIAAEAARRESEERFRLQTETLQTVVENIPVAVNFFDRSGKLQFANRESERLLGWPAAEAREIDLLAACYPDAADRKSVRAFMNAAVGDWKDFRTRTRDGRTIDTAWANVRLSDGTLVGVGQDMSERRRLEGEYRQAQKMEAVGRLAGGVAHDFNNLLGVITGYGELLKKRLPPDPQLRKYTDDILRAAHRAAGLTRQLLAFSRKQVLEPKVVDLNQVIPDLAKMIQRLIGEDIETVIQLAPDLGQVLADPGQLEQVIMNLAVNARDAMPDGGRLILETSNVELDASYARAHTHPVPGRYVLLAVSDTGCGMDAATRAHAFEPFFTTKEAGKGTGLGLATVYGIVKQSGGDIWLYSEPGQGTVFKIFLPRIDAAAAREAADGQPAGAILGTETILLVEDDEALRMMTKDMLEASGYTVLVAARSEEALALSRRHEGTIDVLLSDVIMPGMNGRLLADRLLLERPGLKVLFVSGYTDDAISHQGLLDSGRLLLQKPFTEEMLTRKMRQAIEGPAGAAEATGG